MWRSEVPQQHGSRWMKRWNSSKDDALPPTLYCPPLPSSSSRMYPSIGLLVCTVTLQASVALLFLVQHFSSWRRGAAGTEGPGSTVQTEVWWKCYKAQKNGNEHKDEEGASKHWMWRKEGQTWMPSFPWGLYSSRDRNRSCNDNLLGDLKKAQEQITPGSIWGQQLGIRGRLKHDYVRMCNALLGGGAEGARG